MDVTRADLRRAYGWLWALLALFVVYGSLVPFAPDWPASDPLGRLAGRLVTVPDHVSRTDVVANVLLFIPIGGFGLAARQWTRLGRRRAWLAAAETLGAAAALSLAVESAQAFTVDRTSSPVDVAGQLAGTLIGLVAWRLVGDDVEAFVTAALGRRTADSRAVKLLEAYALVWLAVNLLPLDLTVDVSELAHRWREGGIVLVPFGEPDAFGAARVGQLVLKALATAPLGLLAAWRTGARPPSGWALLLALGLVAAVEVAQVFILSHLARATDALVGWVGVLTGLAIGVALPGLAGGPARPAVPRSDAGRATREPRLRWWVPAALTGWLAVLAAYHWQPFDFTADPPMVRDKIARLSLLPFAGYWSGSYLNALDQLITKAGFGVPLGLLLARVAAALPGASRRLQAALVVLAAALVLMVVEVGQVFLPTRVADPTDVLVGVAGAALGLVLARWLAGAQARRP